MSDKEFTDEEIIKRLERCVKRGNRNYDTDIVLDLINRQKAENLELRLKVNELLAYKQEVTKNNIKNYETYKSQKAEIERHKRYYYRHEYDKWEKEIKSEAHKDFVEKLKEKLGNCYTKSDGEYCGFDCGDIHECIDNLLKEMVGEEE